MIKLQFNSNFVAFNTLVANQLAAAQTKKRLQSTFLMNTRAYIPHQIAPNFLVCIFRVAFSVLTWSTCSPLFR